MLYLALCMEEKCFKPTTIWEYVHNHILFLHDQYNHCPRARVADSGRSDLVASRSGFKKSSVSDPVFFKDQIRNSCKIVIFLKQYILIKILKHIIEYKMFWLSLYYEHSILRENKLMWRLDLVFIGGQIWIQCF